MGLDRNPLGKLCIVAAATCSDCIAHCNLNSVLISALDLLELVNQRLQLKDNKLIAWS